MINEIEQFIWAEKYRPREVNELIATDGIKAEVQGILDKGQIQNLLLVGASGIGKTTIARLLVDKVGGDFLFINASLNGDINTLRTDIAQFASTVSLFGGRKYVILDEADGLGAETQKALRGFIETFSGNCSFILTANYRNKILDAIQSRCAVSEFKVSKTEIPLLSSQFMKRTAEILTAEGVEWDKAPLAQFIMAKAPNWRAILNDLQLYANRNGKIDNGILGSSVGDAVEQLPPLFKERNFLGMRKWVSEVSGNDVFTAIASGLAKHMLVQSVPDLYMIVAKYQYQAAFVADQEVNLAACLAEILAACQFNT